MDEFITKGLDYLMSGGFKGIIMILVAIIVALLWDRKNLVENIEKKEEKIDEIIDNYYKGNMTLTEALSGLKILLSEIKSKLR